MILTRFVRGAACGSGLIALALSGLFPLTIAAQQAGGAGFVPELDPPVEAGNFPAIAPGTSMPPDTNGAVGPNHLLVATNGTVRIQDRVGTVLSSVNLLSFWSGLGVSDVFDPRSYFDPYSERFFMITCAERRSAASVMLLAVSETDDPTGNWHRWVLDADPADINWADYGNLGFTAGEITFTVNLFTNAADAFSGVQFWRIDKASAMDGGGLTMETFRVTGAGGTLVPAVTLDLGQNIQYVIRTGSSNLFGTGRVQLYQLDGVLGASSLATAPSAALGSAWSIALPDAPQLGTSSRIETNDDRIQSAVYRFGRIWCAHTVGLPVSGPSRTAAKWWSVEPATGLPHQSGVLDDTANQYSYYYPSIAVNSQGLMMLGCSGSSAADYVGAYYAWRNPDTVLGGLEGSQRYHAGVGPFTGPRWGDYSGIYVDPVDGTSLWVLQQYAEASNRWGIQWVQLTVNQRNSLPVLGWVGMAVLFALLCGLGWWVRRQYLVVKSS